MSFLNKSRADSSEQKPGAASPSSDRARDAANIPWRTQRMGFGARLIRPGPPNGQRPIPYGSREKPAHWFWGSESEPIIIPNAATCKENPHHHHPSH